MSTIRRLFFGCSVSLLAIAGGSEAGPAGNGGLLAVALLLAWVEWRAWKKPALQLPLRDPA